MQLGLYVYGGDNNAMDETRMPVYIDTTHLLNLGYKEDLIKLFELYINNGYYPYPRCDDYYISAVNINHHRIHDLMLYGYDSVERLFLAYSFNGQRITYFSIPYEEMINAVFSEEARDESAICKFYKLKNESPKLNIEKVKWHLLDYYESVDTQSREMPGSKHRYNESWGLDTYEAVKKRYLWARDVRRYSGIGPTLLLHEHKKDMSERVKYLKEHSPLSYTDEILSGFTAAQSESLMLVRQVMKLNMMRFEKCEPDMEILLGMIDKIHKTEKDAIEKYLNFNEAVFAKL